eukprot:GHUV01032734.1.p2 GENE.GHUV01032734.1~~GHUV01032734.1.p2  ORF type:complete len:143 (-),score=36.64 GHUV01032734.1:204-632(-)
MLLSPGAVQWVRGLMERLQEPMGKLQSMDASVQEMPAFKAAQHSYEAVMAEMQQYEKALVQDWCSQVRYGMGHKLLSACTVMGRYRHKPAVTSTPQESHVKPRGCTLSDRVLSMFASSSLWQAGPDASCLACCLHAAGGYHQ